VNLNAQSNASMTRSLARGTHTVKAVFAGTANFNTSSSQTVTLNVT
jgi:hypothetical protein